MRAVGSGHSWSDVALTEGFLLRTDGLARVPAPEPDFVRPEWTQAGRRLVRAEGGTRIKELNAWLDANGMGLSNMGGYDHQTIAGVTATSTHGSGIEFGPLNDALRSLDVVVGDGSVQRIEPTDGPTDRAAYEAHHGEARTLVQDDHVFDAVCVGMGCMGVICTAMVEVRDRFHMREVRELHPWAKVKADLQDGAVLARQRALRARLQPVRRRLRLPVPRHDARPGQRPAQPAVGQAHAQPARRGRGAASRSRRTSSTSCSTSAPSLAPKLLLASVKRARQGASTTTSASRSSTSATRTSCRPTRARSGCRWTAATSRPSRRSSASRASAASSAASTRARRSRCAS